MQQVSLTCTYILASSALEDTAQMGDTQALPYLLPSTLVFNAGRGRSGKTSHSEAYHIAFAWALKLDVACRQALLPLHTPTSSPGPSRAACSPAL